MKPLRWLVWLSVFLIVVACGGQGSPGESPAGASRLLITNGTVVDGFGSEPIRDGVVVIEDGRISVVGRASDDFERSDAQIIDAHGGTILPGIVDAHVHSASDPGIRHKFLTHGVTAVCDLGSPLETMPQFATDFLDQEPAARGFRAGPILTAPGGLPGAVLQPDLNLEVGTPGEARTAVDDLGHRGADVIKVYVQGEASGTVYPMLSEEQLAAIVEEAQSQGLLVRAHVTYVSLLGMAVRAGVQVIEHVPVNVTQSEAQSVTEAERQSVLEASDPLPLFFAKLCPECEDHLQRMVEEGIVLIPTLDRPYGDLYRAPEPTPEQQLLIELVLGIVRRFHELGGIVGLGTDYNLGRVAGMPLGEMEMLQAAGLTPMQVLEASTRHAAYACGQGSELGTLETGKLADLIVVAGDPLQDLQAMNEVALVVKGGEVVVISEGMLLAPGRLSVRAGSN